jgi:hypothetical protein
MKPKSSKIGWLNPCCMENAILMGTDAKKAQNDRKPKIQAEFMDMLHNSSGKRPNAIRIAAKTRAYGFKLFWISDNGSSKRTKQLAQRRTVI